MATHDFFLLERAAQLQRLLAEDAVPQLSYPVLMARLGASKPAAQLWQALDEILKIPLQDKPRKWGAWLAETSGKWLGKSHRAAKDGEPALALSPAQRQALLDFEQLVIDVALDANDKAASQADAIVTAILLDFSNFAGLKPLPSYADSFAYELLFPSWLNLYSALTLTGADGRSPRFSRVQVQALFGLLRACCDDGEADAEFLGLLTLVVHRRTPDQARTILQRMIDLGWLAAPASWAAAAQRVARLCEFAPEPAELLNRIDHLTLFECAAWSERITPGRQLGPPLARQVPLPAWLVAHVQTLERAPESFAEWSRLVEIVAQMVAQGGVEEHWAEFLESQSARLRPWLELAAARDGRPALPPASQRMLALLAHTCAPTPGEPVAAPLRAFALTIAPRLASLGDDALALFQRQFITAAAGREMILRAASQPEQRRSLAQKLLGLAGEDAARDQLFSLMLVAAAIDPSVTLDDVQRMAETVHVLTLAETRGYISGTQMAELAGDVRNRLPQSLGFLALPHRGAAGQSGSLGRLYLALHEECEKFAASGQIGNFGLTSAAYRLLEGRERPPRPDPVKT